MCTDKVRTSHNMLHIKVNARRKKEENLRCQNERRKSYRLSVISTNVMTALSRA